VESMTDWRTAAAPLTVAFDGDTHVLGRADRGVYVAVPEAGAIFIATLQETGSVADATARASEAAGEEVDGLDFLTGLADAGLIDRPGSDVADPAAPPPDRRIRWIEGVSPRTAQRFFGRPAWTLYGAAAVFSVATLALRPDLRPHFEDLWYLTDPVLSLALFIAASMVLGAVHEMWHWLAGRALGVPAVFRLSRRGVFLVLETDLTQVVTIHRRRRYGAYLAGLAFDGVVLAAALGARLAYRAGVLAWPPVLDRFLGAIALGQVLTISWQFAAVFARNDMYAVLANALRCHNLYRVTVLTTKDRLWRLTDDEALELAAASQRDRRTARWFGVVFIAGMCLMWVVFLTFTLPYVAGMTAWLWTNLRSLTPTTLAFWESLFLLGLLLGGFVLPGALAWRERRLQHRQALL